MKKFFPNSIRRCFLALFFTTTLGLAGAWAQVAIDPIRVFGPVLSTDIDIDATTGVNDACLGYDMSNDPVDKTYSITSITGVTGPITYSWSIKGGAQIVGSTTGSSVTVSPIIDDNRYNKSRLYLDYAAKKSTTIPNPCDEEGDDIQVDVPITGQLYVDLYQKFTVTDPIVGEECIEATKDYAFSIRDMVSGDKDGIGVDSYEWDLTNIADLLPQPPLEKQRLYTSGDGSAIALHFYTSPETPATFTVVPGKCNTTAVVHTLKTMMPAPSYTIEGYDDCIPASVKIITITNTNVVDDVVYTWELANSNFTFVGTVTEGSVDVNIGAYAGFVYLKASPDPASSLCAGTTGEVIATIEIKRSLDGSVHISGDKCVDPSGDDPEYTLNPNPGTKVHWTFPDANWAIDNPDNENASTVTVTVDDALAGPGTISVATLGCLEQTITLDVNFPPGTVGDINEGTSTICLDYGNDDPILLEIDPVANAKGYFWKLPEGWEFQSDDPEINDEPSITVIPDGIHSGAVEVYAIGKGECEKSNTSTRTYAFNAVKPTAVTADHCINSGKAGQVTFSVTSPVENQTYNWVEPAFSGWTIDSYEDVGTSVHAKVIMNTDGVNGSYVVTVRGTNTCFTTTYYNYNTSISAAVAEMAVINGFGNDQFAIFQESTPPRVNMPAGTTYQWYSNHNAISGATNFNLLLDNYQPGSTVGVDVKLSGNNCVTYLETTSDYAASLRKGPNEEETVVLPNPATNEVRVKINRSFSSASFKLKDASGKSVRQVDKASQETAISTVDIPNGIYLLEINIDGETQVKKVQVLH